MPRYITLQYLHRFENKYARTPDILQLAFSDLGGNKKGYFAPIPSNPLLIAANASRQISSNLNSMISHTLILPTPHHHPLPPLNQKRYRSYLPFGVATFNICAFSSYENAALFNSMKNPSSPRPKHRRFAIISHRSLLLTKVSSVSYCTASLFPWSRNISVNMLPPLFLNEVGPTIIKMALRISGFSIGKSKNSFASQ